MEKLYIDGAVNRIYEESSDFDLVNVTTTVDLSFKDREIWVDVSTLSNNDKNIIMDYLRINYDGSTSLVELNSFRRHIEDVKGLIFHCENNGYNDIASSENEICISYDTYNNYEYSPNAEYVNGGDIVTQTKNHTQLKESEEEKDPSIIDGMISDLNLSKSFLFTFGTGIGALMEPVTKLLEGSGIQLTSTQITLLIITSLAIMLNESNTDGAIKKLKEDGIYQYLNGVKDFINNTHELLNSILKNVMNTTYGLADILGFTFILQPAMKVITELITDYGVSLDSVGQLLIGVGAGAATYAVKGVIRKLRNRIGKGGVNETVDDDFKWANDIETPIPITELDINDKYKFISYPASFLSVVKYEITRNSNIELLDEITFQMDDEDNFLNSGDRPERYNNTFKDGDDKFFVWCDEEHFRISAWLPLKDVYVNRMY